MAFSSNGTYASSLQIFRTYIELMAYGAITLIFTRRFEKEKASYRSFKAQEKVPAIAKQVVDALAFGQITLQANT
jgi:hypothetical protein